MFIIPEVGDTVLVNKYCYTNEYGGTNIAEEQIVCEITKAWHDYECGWRYHAIPVNGRFDKIYVSEFDVLQVME